MTRYTATDLEVIAVALDEYRTLIATDREPRHTIAQIDRVIGKTRQRRGSSA